MANSLLARLWLGRAVYLSAAILILFIGLIPLHFVPRIVTGPDTLICLTFAFALRRPDFVPIWLLAGVFFLADILTQRPPGLWTAIIVLAIEFTRQQEYRFRELVFPLEWAFMGGVYFLALLCERLILSAAVVPSPGFGSVMIQYSLTVLAYPLVVIASVYVLQVRKVTPEIAIQYGHRL